MLVQLNDYMKHIKMKITKENLFKLKREIIENIVDKEIKSKYIYNISKDSKSQFYLYTTESGEEFWRDLSDKTRIHGFCILRDISSGKKYKTYGMPLIGIHERFRNMGYGKDMFNKLLKNIIEKTNKPIQIYIHSLERCVGFYERLGFKKVEDECELLHKYEEIDEEDIIMLLER
jgi:ribosomal protein S18 acetylase RimI-like enzyme